MITLISGTNREDSNTLRVTQEYYKELNRMEADVQILDLRALPVCYRSPELVAIENELLIPSDKFIFILPEYNGSFPGILKTMIDNTDIRKTWWHKKALLVGLASGRGGNLRGVDQLSNILHYLKINVFHNKMLLSKIQEELDAEGMFYKTSTKEVIKYQIEEFLKF
ncbi:MAG TPA: NAD(P)H-dependent oxidoreductase [Edaphocola sp.]|nr:NAD(P)H-dependent oxidoreductase [Edaphocola sp.]